MQLLLMGLLTLSSGKPKSWTTLAHQVSLVEELAANLQSAIGEPRAVASHSRFDESGKRNHGNLR